MRSSAGQGGGGGRLAVALAGADGRMGRLLVEAVLAAPDAELTGALARGAGLERVRAALKAHGEGAATAQGAQGAQSARSAQGAASPVVSDKPEEAFAGARVVLDFTSPAAAPVHLAAAMQAGAAYLAGMTGPSDPAFAPALEEAARRIAVLLAPNTSLGIALLARLTEAAAAALPEEDWDAEILELHHRGKEDAPSGTALRLGRAVAAGRGSAGAPSAPSPAPAAAARSGPRAPGVGYAVLRGGTAPGEHAVLFAGPGERIVLSHMSEERGLYVRGALALARRLARAPPGVFDPGDLLLPG